MTAIRQNSGQSGVTEGEKRKQAPMRFLRIVGRRFREARRPSNSSQTTVETDQADTDAGLVAPYHAPAEYPVNVADEVAPSPST